MTHLSSDARRNFRAIGVRAAAAAAVAAVATLMPRAVPAQLPPTSCSVVSQNLFVRDVLFDIYLWYRMLPDVDPAEFASPEAYLEAVRYRTLDRSFSYITSRQASDAFYSDSQFVGLGFSIQTIGDEMRVLQVFPDSPAAEAGLGRGHRILEIDGRPVADLIASGEIGGAFGPGEIGFEVELLVEDRDARPARATLAKRLVTIPTVSLTRVLEVEGRKVGYVFFRNFVRPSYDALNEAFETLGEAGATELVLDLRYNGGGLVDVAVHLGSLIGGALAQGQVFATYAHNDKNTYRNQTLRFRRAATELRLSRLVVITTRGSASASELLINALQPYVPVILIGEATYGKPVGQYLVPFCDKVVAPVAFSMRNARGEGDYFDGLPPDCAAADDLGRDLGDEAEASLAEALQVARTGACSAQAEVAARALGVARVATRATGWQALLNAY